MNKLIENQELILSGETSNNYKEAIKLPEQLKNINPEQSITINTPSSINEVHESISGDHNFRKLLSKFELTYLKLMLQVFNPQMLTLAKYLGTQSPDINYENKHDNNQLQ
ncbi:MAG: hypothetical protein WC570_02775 [Patescibacteria group bacterium]